MSITNTDLQLIDQLPAVIELQITLLKQWCNNNGWTEVHISSDYQIYAFPPGSFISSPLPKEAFTQIEELGDIFYELSTLQQLKQLLQISTKLALISLLACTSVIGLRVLIREAIDTSSFPAIVYNLLDFSIILLLMIVTTSGNLALSGWWKYRKVKIQLAKAIVMDSSGGLKDIAEGAFMQHDSRKRVIS